MAGVARSFFDAIKTRLEPQFPELGVDEPKNVFEVDRARREVGAQPTTLGAATENAYITSSWPSEDEAMGASRGADIQTSPYPSPDEAMESSRGTRVSPDRGFFGALYGARTTPAPVGGGVNAFDWTMRQLARPSGAVNAFAEAEGTNRGIPFLDASSYQKALEGWNNPEAQGISSMLQRHGASDKDLPGPLGSSLGLSATDVTGGIAGMALDPLNWVGTGAIKDVAGISKPALGAIAKSDAIQVAGRAAGRLAVDEAGSVALPRAAIRQAPFSHPATSAGKQLFGIGDIEAKLTQGQSDIVALREKLGIGIPNNEIATPAMKVRDAAQLRIRAQASQISARTSSALQRAFNPDGAGRIKSLPGAPTIQDVAAQRPRFAGLLTPAQQKALDITEQTLAPVKQFLDEVGLKDVGVRPDVMDGGFYIPRGNALEAGADAPLKVHAGGGYGKASFQKEAVFNSQAEGVDAGFKYAPLRDAIKGYVQAAGVRGTNEHVANYLRQFGKEIPEQGIGRTAGSIGPGLPLHGLQFDDAIANAVNKVLRSEGETLGRGAFLHDTLTAVSDVVRGIQAGGELSYLTIQGGIGAAADQKGYGTALKLATKALGSGGDEVLGAYFNDFAERVSAKGAPDTARWVANGLQIGGPDTEFKIGRGLGKKLSGVAENLPLVRQTNRGYGTFGDVLRVELADTLWDEALASGKNMDDPAVLEAIAKTANRATGWSTKKAFGNWGEVLQFAPRFFASKLENVAQLASTNKMERQLARRTFGRYLTAAAMATVGANAALGQETDFNPTKKIGGKTVKNPNFMRVRALGRDWSFFGSYDSLLGMAISAGTGDLQGTARTLLTGPVVSSAWDLISGSTLTGTPTRDQSPDAPLGGLASSETAQYFATRPLPFAAPTALQAGQEIAAGNLPEAAGSALQAGLGLRGSPLTPTEQLDQVTPGGSFFDAKPTLKEKVKRDNPELWAQYESSAKTGSPRATTQALRERYAEQQQGLDSQLAAGRIDPKTWRDRRGSLLDQASGALSAVYLDSPKKEPDPTKPWEVYGKKIATEKEAAGGFVDDEGWARIEAWRASLTPQQNEAIDRESGIGTTPTDRKYRADMKKIAASGYFDLRDEIVKRVSGTDTTWGMLVSELRADELVQARIDLENEDPEWHRHDPTLDRQLMEARVRQKIAKFTASKITPVQQRWRALPENQDEARLLREWGLAGTGMKETLGGIASQLQEPVSSR